MADEDCCHRDLLTHRAFPALGQSACDREPARRIAAHERAAYSDARHTHLPPPLSCAPQRMMASHHSRNALAPVRLSHFGSKMGQFVLHWSERRCVAAICTAALNRARG